MTSPILGRRHAIQFNDTAVPALRQRHRPRRVGFIAVARQPDTHPRGCGTMVSNKDLRKSIAGADTPETQSQKPKGSHPLALVIAWTWTVIVLVSALGALMFGGITAGLFYLLSGLAVLPPLWAGARRVPGYIRAIASFVLFLIAVPFNPETNGPVAPEQTGAQKAAVADPDARQEALKQKLTIFEKKIGEGAVLPMTRADFKKTHAKLGAAKFGEANALMRWAALAAAESDQCPAVDNMGLSDSATAKKLIWYVDCSGSERFMIDETQASATRDRLDPAVTSAARAKAEQFAIAQPKSARWKDFNESNAATACDLLTQQAMLVPRSFSTGFNRWQIEKNDETGIVTIERDYKSENAYSMKINGRYRCVIDSDKGNIKGLSIREPDGWKKLL